MIAMTLEVCLHGLVIDESLLSGGLTRPTGHLWLLLVPSSGEAEHTESGLPLWSFCSPLGLTLVSIASQGDGTWPFIFMVICSLFLPVYDKRGFAHRDGSLLRKHQNLALGCLPQLVLEWAPHASTLLRITFPHPRVLWLLEHLNSERSG